MRMNPTTFRILVHTRPISPPRGKQRSLDEQSAEARKKWEEDATKAGYNDVFEYLDDRNKKDPVHLRAVAHLYQECAAKHGAESEDCKYYKKRLLECKTAQNA